MDTIYRKQKIKRGIQKFIRDNTKLSGTGYISAICNCDTRVNSWTTAKDLARATGSHPLLWVEGTCDDIQTWLNSLDLEGLKTDAAA